MKTLHFLIAGLRARAEDARGAGPTGRTAALRDLQIQLEPRVPRSEVALQSASRGMVPGSARNWIAVNAVQQSSLN